MPAAATKTLDIGDLVPDPANCRRHNPRNVGAIVNSLQKVGAARSIVIDEDNVILAGNGLVDAAGEAGITKLMVVEADGETVIAVRRRGLTPKQKAELAIADNRTSELSDWDPDQLLKTIAEYEIDPGEVEFTQDELDKLAGSDMAEMGDGEGATKPVNVGESFQVVVECNNEDDQRLIFEELTAKGRKCRVLTL